MAIITTFTHTIGEFGVVMMLGGDILGETRVASIAILKPPKQKSQTSLVFGMNATNL